MAIVAITALAGFLRLVSLHAVPLDPFYDAAVRSMSLSFHNFFFGAYEPAASVSIDKPPLDLWLQVVSVKLFGFGSTQLKLPQAVGGTLAVPLVYDAMRRVFGEITGLAGALVLAILPVAVLTARSDTMDAVMMVLNVLAFWCLLRYATNDRPRWLYLAAAVMGLAFNVKLFEALVALPALVAVAVLATGRQRLRRALFTTATFAVCAVSWLTVVSLVPGPDRPYPIGSTNGSVWNAAFVFNGYDRIAKPASQADLSGGEPGHARKAVGKSEVQRAKVPIGSPSLLRLFDHDGPLSGLRLGFVLLTALALGLPALLASLRRPRLTSAADRAAALGLLIWLATGVVLFSAMARLHPRYTDAFTPAVAAAAGLGLAWVARDGRQRRAVAIAAAVGLTVYGHHLLDSSSTTWRITATAAALVAAASLIPGRPRLRTPLLAGGLAVAALSIPAHVTAGLIRHHESDAGRVGVTPASTAVALSSYLRAHQGSARYEFAAEAATRAAAVIVRDGRPVLILTSFNGRPFTSVPALARSARAGQVRYALLGGGCGPQTKRTLPACSPQAAWVRAHGTDVSMQARLPRSKLLWRLATR